MRLIHINCNCILDNGDNEIKTEALIQSLIRQCISLENMHISQGSLSETGNKKIIQVKCNDIEYYASVRQKKNKKNKQKTNQTKKETHGTFFLN